MIIKVCTCISIKENIFAGFNIKQEIKHRFSPARQYKI